MLAIFPADHVIEDQQAFEQSLNIVVEAAMDDQLVAFGIKPTKAETGYGYIKAQAGEKVAKLIECFVEKPNQKTAQRYVASGDYYWNSGMFVFKTSTYLSVLASLDANMIKYAQLVLHKACVDLDFIRLDRSSFEQCANQSIDYAVMEQATNVSMVPMSAGWSDLGSWDSLWEVCDKNEDNNALMGDVISINCKNMLVHNSDKLVTIIGLENVVIVDTKDALLVANREQVQQVKAIVEQIKQTGRSEHLLHREVHRPWGSYDLIDEDYRYQVKRIKVKPGASLSLQLHHHRTEHWIIVTGTA